MFLDLGFKAGHSSPRTAVFLVGAVMDPVEAQRKNGRDPSPSKYFISALAISLPKYGDLTQRIRETLAANSVSTASFSTSHIEEPYAYGNHRAALI
jgi:hypothetical protein